MSAQHLSGTVQGPGDTGNKPVSALMAFILWVILYTADTVW